MNKDNVIRRSTEHRRLILDLLRGTRTHPTARDLHDQVRRYLPRCSLGTVYRNLEVLAEEGLVQRLVVAGQGRYDAVTRPHHHASCTTCGRIDDVPPAADAERELHLAEGGGYKILSCHITFAGICPDCRRDRRDATPAGGVP